MIPQTAATLPDTMGELAEKVLKMGFHQGSRKMHEEVWRSLERELQMMQAGGELRELDATEACLRLIARAKAVRL